MVHAPIADSFMQAGLRKAKGSPHWAEVNHTELQEWIKRRIHKHGDKIGGLGLGTAATVQNDIREAMGRVWEHVSNNEKGVQLGGN